MQETVTDEDIFRLVRRSAGHRAHLISAEDAEGFVLAELYSAKTKSGKDRKGRKPLVDAIKSNDINYASSSVRNRASTEVWEAEVAEAKALGSDYWCSGRTLPEHVTKFTWESSKCVCGLVHFLSGAKYAEHPDRLGVVRMEWCGSPEVMREFNKLKEIERAQLARVYEDRIVAESGTTERSDFDIAFNHLRGNLNITSVNTMVRSYDQILEDGGDIKVTEVDILDLIDDETGEVDYDGRFRYEAFEGSADDEG